ncbi:hypothetical protein [Stenotrophomonas sp. PS02301]|uniref:hypothetical protein n=1 Tax=Stenotrophomonas sp. PS02301 TaxID=2991427 RepID=UPI00249BC9EC|nr:hypothetical protein [Stenotrophomonas sp. PS02301]
MDSIQKYTRSGSYKGIEFDVEIWHFDTGEVMVQAVQIDGERPRKLADGHRDLVDVEDAFQLGSEIAREAIDRR